jgi:hypothetical protein
MIDEVATAGPGASPPAADAFCTKVPAVTSANAMITYTREIQMNARNSRYDRRFMYRRTTSAIDFAPWRTEATSVIRSCTPPMKIAPKMIQIQAGIQPK